MREQKKHHRKPGTGNSVCIVLTSRLASRRLPNKALAKIAGKTAIEITLENLLRQNQYPVILAIPESRDCDILADIASEFGVVKVHRGQDDSPLHRLCEAARGFDHVVRVTQDDILVDAVQLCRQVGFHLHCRADYTFMSRILDGAAGEVIRTAALERAANAVGARPVEHVSYFVKRAGFEVREYFPPYEYQFSYRCTMDWPEDLALLRAVFGLLPKPVGVLDVINLLRKREFSHLLEINRLPAVTVYTCCHNQGRFVRDCLVSVAAQTFRDFELVVIDDASTDDTPAVVNEWTTTAPEWLRFRVVRNPERRGLPACSNIGVGMARGRYTVRIDADDAVRPAFLETMVREIEARDTSAVFSAYETTDADMVPTGVQSNTELHPGCCLLRTKSLHDVRYREGLEHYEGAEFFRRFREVFGHEVLGEPLWFYRRHPGSKSAVDTPERAEARRALGTVDS